MFLCIGTMVVCLEHVGITDSDRERLKMSMKAVASWLANAQSSRSGNPSGPAALWMLTCLTHIGNGERDHTVVWNS